MTLDTVQSITGKRSLVLSRSTFVGSGQWSGHWLGDNEATWHEMKRSLIGMIEFNWFGIPLNGADICGFDKTATEEMCIRLENFKKMMFIIYFLLVGCKLVLFIHFHEM